MYVFSLWSIQIARLGVSHARKPRPKKTKNKRKQYKKKKQQQQQQQKKKTKTENKTLISNSQTLGLVQFNSVYKTSFLFSLSCNYSLLLVLAGGMRLHLLFSCYRNLQKTYKTIKIENV